MINVLIVSLFVATLFRRIINHRKILSPLTLGIFLYISYIAISSVLVHNNLEALLSREFYDLIFTFLMVLVLDWNVKEIKQVKIIGLLLVIAAIFQTSLAILQLFGGEEFYLEQYYKEMPPKLYITGFFEGSGKLAEFMLLAFCLGLSRWFVIRKRSELLIQAILVAAFSCTIVLTISRGSIGMMIAAFFFVALLCAKRVIGRRATLNRVLSIFIILTCCGVIMKNVVPGRTIDLMEKKALRYQNPQVSEMGIFMERSAINKAAWDMFWESPFFGSGFGKFSSFSWQYVWKYTTHSSLVYQYMEAHNSYTENLVDCGVFGSILYVSILIIALKNYWSVFRHLNYNMFISTFDVIYILLIPYFVYFMLLLVMLFFGYGLVYHTTLLIGMSAVFKNMKDRYLHAYLPGIVRRENLGIHDGKTRLTERGFYHFDLLGGRSIN